MSIPALMPAVLQPEAPGADQLRVEDMAVPEITDDQVLIKVTAAGVNRPDILQRDGHYPAPPGHSLVLGLEVSGHIAALGKNVHDRSIGDEVTALVNGGGYAAYSAAHKGTVLPRPSSHSLIDAAGLPEVVLTVWHNVFQRGRLKQGDWLLVHGGSSGIGSMAIQMARAFGARVIATAGSDVKCAACLELGAEAAVNYQSADFVEEVKTITDGHGADVILDMVGGDYIERNFKAAAVEGRIVQIAFLKGAKVDINFMRVMLKRLSLTGSTLRARDDLFKAALTEEVQTHIWPLFEQGTIRPVIDKVFALEDVSAAHQYLESGAHIGKVLLKI